MQASMPTGCVLKMRKTSDSYEGKILRFNLEPDSDGDVTVPNAWIPNDNPYNTLLGKQSAVYSIGIRNNQGFAYDTAYQYFIWFLAWSLQR